MGTPVIDRPREGLDDPGLPPLPPDPDWGEGPSWHGPPETHLLGLIAWTVMLVFALPAAYLIEVMLSHVS